MTSNSSRCCTRTCSPPFRSSRNHPRGPRRLVWQPSAARLDAKSRSLHLPVIGFANYRPGRDDNVNATSRVSPGRLNRLLHVKLKTSNSGENHGEDCKDSRSQESDGHIQEHGLPQVRQAHPHRETGQGSRTRNPRWGLHFLLGVRILREVVRRFSHCQRKPHFLPLIRPYSSARAIFKARFNCALLEGEREPTKLLN